MVDGMRSMEERKKAIEAEMRALRKAYLARLPSEIKTLASMARKMDTQTFPCADLEHIHAGLHKLAGSGGSFGLPNLTLGARRLEQIIAQWLANPTCVHEERSGLYSSEGLAQAIEHLITVLEDTPKEIITELLSHFEEETIEKRDESILIWLLETDETVRTHLGSLLDQFGYRIRFFSERAVLEQALSEAKEKPDILVADEVCLHLENGQTPFKENPTLPLVLLSEKGDFSSRIRAARLGAADFLLKPIDALHLVERLERFFGEHNAQPYRILIVDDDEALSAHFRLVLTRAEMDVKVLNKPEAIIEAVSRFRPELVLMDMQMPSYSGPELASVIRQHTAWLGLPIVFLSAETDLDKQMRALGHGADDFLTKPISDVHLVSAVSVRVSRARQLADLMAKDSLTGLLKHGHIKEEIGVHALRAARLGRPLCVAMLDIDHFKSVNDTYGHAVGDLVIKAVAHLLRQRTRKTDVVGRYGGEEFVIVLPECGLTDGRMLLDDIRSRFAALRFEHEGHAFSRTLSAGVACLDPLKEEAETARLLLLERADQALYRAKHGGRNRVCTADTNHHGT
jgi:diguanylate cyclase (GGDEF)-like protein